MVECVVLLIFLCLPSSKGANKYGDKPTLFFKGNPANDVNIQEGGTANLNVGVNAQKSQDDAARESDIEITRITRLEEERGASEKVTPNPVAPASDVPNGGETKPVEEDDPLISSFSNVFYHLRYMQAKITCSLGKR